MIEREWEGRGGVVEFCCVLIWYDRATRVETKKYKHCLIGQFNKGIFDFYNLVYLGSLMFDLRSENENNIEYNDK